MGWSCTQVAGLTLDAITEFCIGQTGSQNVFESNGNRYMLEIGREQHDGAVCGTIWKFLPDGFCRKSGSLRIESNGKISRGPAILKKLRVLHFVMGNGIVLSWLTTDGDPNEENLAAKLEEWNDSYKVGGANEHISRKYGYLYVIDSARIEDLDGNTVAEYRHGMFQVI